MVGAVAHFFDVSESVVQSALAKVHFYKSEMEDAKRDGMDVLRSFVAPRK